MTIAETFGACASRGAESKGVEGRHELALYSSISRIQWHYEEAGRLKGDVTNTEKGTVQHFDVDPTGMSLFDQVNHMWSVLAA